MAPRGPGGSPVVGDVTYVVPTTEKETERIVPPRPRRAARTPIRFSADTSGTFKLRTVAGGASAITGRRETARSAAVLQGTGTGPYRMEVASPRTPNCAAVKAAPIVPE